MLGFGGNWPYGDKLLVVLSSRPVAVPRHLTASVRTMSGAPQEVVGLLGQRSARHLCMDGGKTIQGFLRAGLIHRLVIIRMPVLLGRGMPLFGPLTADIGLRHVSTRSFPNGRVQSRYELNA